MNNFKSKLNNERYAYLEEAKGVPNILKTISNNIYDNFVNYPDNEIEYLDNSLRYKIELKKNEFEYPFFEILIVYITVTNDENDKPSYYNYNNSNWLPDKKLFERVVINIYIEKNYIEDLQDITKLY